jgi:hypothetical protein
MGSATIAGDQNQVPLAECDTTSGGAVDTEYRTWGSALYLCLCLYRSTSKVPVRGMGKAVLCLYAEIDVEWHCTSHSVHVQWSWQ